MNYDAYPYSLLTKYFLDGNRINENTKYEIIKIKARDLITSRRIDLMAKWLFIEAQETGKNQNEALSIYREHIRVWSNGTYIESGTPEKNSFEKYLQTFQKIIKDIKTNGFDESVSLIPAGRDYVILDGAHRVSSAAFFDKEVKIIYFPTLSVNYDALYFKKKGLGEEYIEKMVQKYVGLKEHICTLNIEGEGLRNSEIMRYLDFDQNSTQIIYTKENAGKLYILFEYDNIDSLKKIESNCMNLKKEECSNIKCWIQRSPENGR